jgi:restriction system protein
MNDGKEFEFEVLRLLQAIGFEAEVTGYSQDGGVDLVATNSSPLAAGKCVVQCKARSRPVGEPVLRDLFGTMHAQ